MTRIRERKSWIVLMAILLLFAACKGETPTAPPPGGGIPPGQSPPPAGAALTLAVSNSSPLVDSVVTITATATLNGQPVPNGTAVEFSSTGGSLNGGGTAILRTTTDGVATVTLTNSTAGLVRVTATVNNVTRTIDTNFQARPTTPPPVNTAPTISSVSPSIGRPQGGEIIRITGSNFKTPVRVLFDTGGPLPVEAHVVSVTDTVIEVITPPVDLGAGQQFASRVIIITQAGSVTEQRVELADAFTFRNLQLTPIITTVTPNSGPVTGGTRVTIIGEGFQEPVQVLFNTAEARVLNVTFNEIFVETPSARDTNPDGSGTVTGPVTVLVRNIASNTSASMASGFLYKAAMQITAAGPTQGLFSGGTRVTIDGIGFLAPVAVQIGGVAARVISVSGTQIIAITNPVDTPSCGDSSGPISVTNINNGDSATGPQFTYRVPQPRIVAVTPQTVVDGVTTSIAVTVSNALPGANRILIGDRTVFPTNTTFNGDGSATFTVPLPTNVEFPTATCPGGERLVPVEFDISYENVDTGCEDTAAGALTIRPADETCQLTPTAEVAVTVPASPDCPGLVINAPDNATNTTGTITLSNSGTAALTVTSAATPALSFTVAPPNSIIPPGGSANFTVTFLPAGGGDVVGNIAFTTNDPDENTVNVCVTGNVPPP